MCVSYTCFVLYSFAVFFSSFKFFHFVFYCISEKFTVHFGSVYLKIITKLFWFHFFGFFFYIYSVAFLFLHGCNDTFLLFIYFYEWTTNAWDEQCSFGLLLQGKCYYLNEQICKIHFFFHHDFHEKYKNPSLQDYTKITSIVTVWHCAHSKCKRAHSVPYTHTKEVQSFWVAQK